MPKLPDKLVKGPPTLIKWLNDMREFVRRGRVLSDGVIGWNDTGDGLAPPTSTDAEDAAGSLYASLSGTDIRVTVGYVNGTTVPNIGGDLLDITPAPTITIGALPYYALLKFEWVPAAGGATPTFYPEGIDTVAEVSIVGATSVTAPQVPTVNVTTGVATQNGIAYFILAHWVDVGGSPSLAARNFGNRWVHVCNVDEAEFIFNGY